MRTIVFALSLAAAGVGSAHAQLFQPVIAHDALPGVVAGAIIAIEPAPVVYCAPAVVSAPGGYCRPTHYVYGPRGRRF